MRIMVFIIALLGINATVKMACSQTPLFEAVLNGSAKEVRRLLREGEDPFQAIDSFGIYNAFVVCAGLNEKEKLDELLEAVSNYNENEHSFAIRVAIQFGAFEALESYRKKGVSPSRYLSFATEGFSKLCFRNMIENISTVPSSDAEKSMEAILNFCGDEHLTHFGIMNLLISDLTNEDVSDYLNNLPTGINISDQDRSIIMSLTQLGKIDISLSPMYLKILNIMSGSKSYFRNYLTEFKIPSDTLKSEYTNEELLTHIYKSIFFYCFRLDDPIGIYNSIKPKLNSEYIKLNECRILDNFNMNVNENGKYIIPVLIKDRILNFENCDRCFSLSNEEGHQESDAKFVTYLIEVKALKENCLSSLLRDAIWNGNDKMVLLFSKELKISKSHFYAAFEKNRLDIVKILYEANKRFISLPTLFEKIDTYEELEFVMNKIGSTTLLTNRPNSTKSKEQILKETSALGESIFNTKKFYCKLECYHKDDSPSDVMPDKYVNVDKDLPNYKIEHTLDYNKVFLELDYNMAYTADIILSVAAGAKTFNEKIDLLFSAGDYLTYDVSGASYIIPKQRPSDFVAPKIGIKIDIDKKILTERSFFRIKQLDTNINIKPNNWHYVDSNNASTTIEYGNIKGKKVSATVAIRVNHDALGGLESVIFEKDFDRARIYYHLYDINLGNNQSARVTTNILSTLVLRQDYIDGLNKSIESGRTDLEKRIRIRNAYFEFRDEKAGLDVVVNLIKETPAYRYYNIATKDELDVFIDISLIPDINRCINQLKACQYERQQLKAFNYEGKILMDDAFIKHLKSLDID